MPNLRYITNPPTPTPIYKAFNISIGITLNSLESNLRIEAKSQLGVDNMPRLKLCSVLFFDSGEYVPCPKCLNYLAKLEPYSQNSASNVTDAFVWSLDSLKMYKVRASFEDLEVNSIRLSVVGQVLDHSSKVENESVNVSLIIYSNNLIISNQTVPIIIGLNTKVIFFLNKILFG
jgi:hypothetical protein